MIPFDFARTVICEASDFEDEAQRIAHDLGISVDALMQVAADLAVVSELSPTESLHRLAQDFAR